MAHPEQIGDYRILRVLGEGGMGVVFCAEHRETGAQVALKTVRLEATHVLASMRREIRALAALTHPGIVRIVEHGLHHGLPWYAMELLAGGSLRDNLREHRRHLRTTRSPGMATGVTPSRSSVEMETGHVGLKPAQLHTVLDASVAPAPGRTPIAQLTPAAELTEPPLPRVPNPIQRAVFDPERHHPLLAVLAQLCRALAYLHGEGLVHGDLKPDNLVLLEEDHRAVLVDFGLVRAERGGMGREKLSASRAGTGSVRYMSPEQIKGDRVDARSDLYALGCMLYECLVGEVPFETGTSAEILRKHLRQSPRPPSLLMDDVPAELESTVLRLLEKSPAKRPGYAEDIARLLEACCGLSPSPTEPPVRTHLYRPTFAGRKDPMYALRKRLRVLHDSPPRGTFVAIGGASGLGKTRLALELLRLALAGERCDVLIADALPHHHAAFSTLRSVFTEICDRARALTPEARADIATELRILAAFEPQMGELPGVATLPPPLAIPPREQIVREDIALLQVLERLAAHKPLLLAIDDLHWADPRTLAWLQRVQRARFSERCPLLIATTYRTHEASPEVLALTSVADEDTLHIELGPLEPEEVADMIQSMLALRDAPEALAEQLHAHTGGNPFFIAELLRSAVGDGLLRRDAEGRWQLEEGELMPMRISRLSLPSAITELLVRRLAHLPDVATELIERAAVLGREVRPEYLLRSRRDEEALDLIIQNDILVFGPVGQLAFAHDTLHHHLYDNIPLERRQRLHHQAAHLFTETFPWPEAAAWHWEHAGVPENASRVYRTLGQAAHRRGELTTASHCFTAVLRVAGETPKAQSAQVRIELSETLYHLGRTEEARAGAQRAHDEALALKLPHLQARALIWMGRLAAIAGELEKGLADLDRAGTLLEALGDRAALGDQRTMLLGVLLDTGQTERMANVGRDALAIHREVGNRRQEGITLGKLAGYHYMRGGYAEGRACLEAALAIHREVGNRHAEGVALSNLANGYLDQGETVTGRELYLQALAIHREVGNRRFEGITLSNLATSYSESRDFEAARPRFSQALVIHREVGNLLFEGITLSNLGVSHVETGRFLQAEILLHQSIAIHQEISNPLFEGYAWTNLGMLARRQHQIDTARSHLAHASALLEPLGNPYLLGLLSCQRGHLALAEGRDPSDAADQARGFAQAVQTSEHSELGQAMLRLEAALVTPAEERHAGEAWSMLTGELRETLHARQRGGGR